MKYFIDPQKKEPAYLQLYQQLRRDIVSGIYPAGSRFPSKRFLSSDTGASLVTIEHALALLEEEGYIETRERSGSFVIYRSGQPFAEVLPERGPADRTPYMVSDTSLSFAVFAAAVRKVLSDYGESLMELSDGKGVMRLRGAIASYLARNRGILVSPEQICIGSGSEYMYNIIVRLLGRERVYGLEDPSYHRIRAIYEANGVRTEMLKMGPDGIDSAALRQAVSTVLHVTPYHSYPTGISADASKKAEYLRWAKERGAYIVEDDFDSEFTISTKAEDTLFAMEGGETVIYLNTFSRTVAPSVRAGYMILPKSLMPVYEEKASFYSCPVNALTQYVLAELLEGGELERHINRVRRRRRKEIRQSDE